MIYTDLLLFDDDINSSLDGIEREHKYCYLLGERGAILDYIINLFNYIESTSFTEI